MTAAAEADQPPGVAPPSRKGGKALVVAAALALLLGGGGFFATYKGFLLAGPADHPADPAAPQVAFVPMPPVILALGTAAANQKLRMTAQIEAPAASAAEVAHLMPRILDVTNTYLRAVEVAELQDPAALSRIRVHLFRRIGIVVGESKVNDLLITEFLLD